MRHAVGMRLYPARHAGSRRVVSTSRDDTLKIWDGAKGLQQLVSIRHYNNTGAPPVSCPAACQQVWCQKPWPGSGSGLRKPELHVACRALGVALPRGVDASQRRRHCWQHEAHGAVQ